MQCKKHPKPLTQHGFSILESIVVLSVMFSLMSLGARYIGQNAQQAADRIAAHQLKQVEKAAYQYLQDHYATFSESSGRSRGKRWEAEDFLALLQPSAQRAASAIQQITFNTLQDEGYLSEQILPHNCYGQGYKIQVVPEPSGVQHQLLITTEGGQTLSESSLRRIADQVGGSGGYVSALYPGKIIGSQGGWTLEGADSASLEVGHLASLTLVNQHEVVAADQFLRRNTVAGHPEYNTMESDLTINNHLLKLTDNTAQVKLSSKTFILEDPLGQAKQKTVSLDIDGSPMLRIKDSYFRPDDSPDMLLSSDRLEFTYPISKRQIYLDNRDPSITVKDDNKTWKTEITPSEIYMESRAGGKKAYVGNDKIRYDSSNQYNLSIDSFSVKTGTWPNKKFSHATITDKRGFFSELSHQYVKIPFIEMKRPSSGYWEDKLGLCGKKELEGAMFMVGVQGSGARVLAVCADGIARQLKSWD